MPYKGGTSLRAIPEAADQIRAQEATEQLEAKVLRDRQ